MLYEVVLCVQLKYAINLNIRAPDLLTAAASYLLGQLANCARGPGARCLYSASPDVVMMAISLNFSNAQLQRRHASPCVSVARSLRPHGVQGKPASHPYASSVFVISACFASACLCVVFLFSHQHQPVGRKAHNVTRAYCHFCVRTGNAHTFGFICSYKFTV